MKKKQYDERVIYAEEFTGYYYPGYRSMKITDGDIPKVICMDDSFRSREPEKMTCYKIDKEGVERIKKLIDSAKYLFSDMPLEEREYIVLDGQKEEYFFRSGDKEAYIKEDNFSYAYPEIARDTKAGEILSIVDAIYEILKEYGIDPDEEDEDLDDEDE